MRPSDIISDARPTLNDTDTVTPRQDDTELLRYVNAGIKEIASYKPALFSTVGDMICVPGKCEQAITFLDAAALIEVLCIHGGAAVTPFDRASMDLFNPNWRNDAAGPAENWSPLDGDPLNFFIYPKAPDTAQVLDVRYVRNPATYALDDLISDLPDTYRPALVDYVIYRAESKDDEHVLSQRAQSHYTAFLAKIGASNGSAAN